MKNPVLILCDQMIEDSEKRHAWIFEAAEQIREWREEDARNGIIWGECADAHRATHEPSQVFPCLGPAGECQLSRGAR